MRCAVIVPFLDEERHIATFLASVDAQVRRPDVAILVDDGSRDRSPEIAEAWAADRPWAAVLRRPPRPRTKDRLEGAPELVAFLWAVEQLPEPFDVIVKMDADLELSPHHFERVLHAFEADQRLGIAGTYLSAVGPHGDVYIEGHPPQHVRGPTRFYRRQCLEAISPIPTMLGWDGADEVWARANGWRTESFRLDGAPSLHLRPTGAHDGRLRARARWGRCAYAIGAHPVGVLAGAARHSRRRPWALGGAAYLIGWAMAWARRAPRAPAPIRAATRREHLSRVRAGVRR
jgi:glycosyltransferase involved in cell wall biosynthesis